MLRYGDFKFDVEECNNSKLILGGSSDVMNVWRANFAPSVSVGNCSNLYRLLKPSSASDFFEKYIDYAEKNKDKRIYDRGLTFNELVDLAERFKEESERYSGENHDLRVYLNNALCHIIVETWDGQQMERDFINYLKSLGYECDKFDGHIDAKYGVDIRCSKDGKKPIAIQIKPISFFYSKREDVKKDRIGLYLKHLSAKNDLGIETFYAIYKKDGDVVKWIKNGDGFRFRLTDLFDVVDGEPIVKILPKETELLPM